MEKDLGATIASWKRSFATAADLVLQLRTAARQGRFASYLNHMLLNLTPLIIEEIGYLAFGKQDANLSSAL